MHVRGGTRSSCGCEGELAHSCEGRCSPSDSPLSATLKSKIASEIMKTLISDAFADESGEIMNRDFIKIRISMLLRMNQGKLSIGYKENK